jgi:hypothetical protein
VQQFLYIPEGDNGHAKYSGEPRSRLWELFTLLSRASATLGSLRILIAIKALKTMIATNVSKESVLRKEVAGIEVKVRATSTKTKSQSLPCFEFIQYKAPSSCPSSPVFAKKKINKFLVASLLRW